MAVPFTNSLYSVIEDPAEDTKTIVRTNELQLDEDHKRNILIFQCIAKMSEIRTKMGERKKNRGSKRTRDGHEKLYTNREIYKILIPFCDEWSEALDFDFSVILFNLIGVESSTIRTYRTAIGNFNRFCLEEQKFLKMPKGIEKNGHIYTFHQIIWYIIRKDPHFLQKLVNRFIIWATQNYSKRSVQNICSGPIFFGEFITDSFIKEFPRPNKKLLHRARKIARKGTGGANVFPSHKLPLNFIEWLLTQDDAKKLWSGVFYALMFYGTLRPTIAYTIHPGCFRFIDKEGQGSKKPNKKTRTVELSVFRYKNQLDHETPKVLYFNWNKKKRGPTPTNIVRILLKLFKKLKVSPTFNSSAKLMQKQLQEFKVAKGGRFDAQKFSPESFRETMMHVAAKKLAPHELMYITHHRSDRSIKHTYLQKHKVETYKTFNEIIKELL